MATSRFSILWLQLEKSLDEESLIRGIVLGSQRAFYIGGIHLMNVYMNSLEVIESASAYTCQENKRKRECPFGGQKLQSLTKDERFGQGFPN